MEEKGWIIAGMLLLLSAAAIQDINRKQLNLYWLLLHGCVIVCGQAFAGNLEMAVIGTGMGWLLLLFAKITGQKIGYGDGWLFVVCGGYVGFWRNVCLLLSALFLCSLWNSLRLLCKRVQWKQEIPFAPYVLLAYIGLLITSHL